MRSQATAAASLNARTVLPLYAKMTKAEEEAEEREIQEEIERKMKGMYNADGKAYAPWMMNQIDVEASARAIRARKRREREAAEATNTGEVNDPQGLEMNAGVGLKYRVINERDVELGWLTGEEKENVGFIVFRKRQGDEGDFEEIASFKNFPPLNTKGPQGGFYSFIDEDVEPGQYIYRITDQDKKNKRMLLCQAGVEVLSKGEKFKNVAVVAVFGALFVGGVLASVLYEPMQ